jgi:large subunit ribosomal protein L32
MAVQKSRKTPSKRGMRRSHNALKNPALSEDQETGETHLRHHIICMGVIGTDINTSSVINSIVENSSSVFRIVSKFALSASPCCSFFKKIKE